MHKCLLALLINQTSSLIPSLLQSVKIDKHSTFLKSTRKNVASCTKRNLWCTRNKTTTNGSSIQSNLKTTPNCCNSSNAVKHNRPCFLIETSNMGRALDLLIIMIVNLVRKLKFKSQGKRHSRLWRTYWPRTTMIGLKTIWIRWKACQWRKLSTHNHWSNNRWENRGSLLPKRSNRTAQVNKSTLLSNYARRPVASQRNKWVSNTYLK